MSFKYTIPFLCIVVSPKTPTDPTTTDVFSNLPLNWLCRTKIIKD